MTSLKHGFRILAAIAVGLGSFAYAQPSGAELRTLRPGSIIEAELRGGESHRYRIDAPAGQPLYLRVDQQGIDVAVVVPDPLLKVDSLNGAYGPEELWLWSGEQGRCQLEIGSGSESAPPGLYELRLAAIRDPGERVRAVQALYEGKQAEDGSRALARFEEALEIWRSAGETYQQGLALLRIARTQRQLGPYDDAIGTYGQALALFEGLDDRRMSGFTLHGLGRVYSATGHLERARRCQERSLKLARELEDRRAEASSLNSLAILDRNEGDARAALHRYSDALAVYQELDDEVGQATVLSNMGRLYSLLGMETEALEVLERALELARLTGRKRLRARSLIEIGWVFYLRGQPEQALEKYQQAGELYDRPQDRAEILDRMGTAYRALGSWEEALAAYDQALTTFHAMNAERDVAQTLLNRAELLLHWDRLEESLAASSEALERFAVSAEPHGEAHGLYLQARALAAGEPEAARVKIEECLGIVEDLRRGLASQALSLPFFEYRQIYHEFHVELLMRLEALHPGSHAALAFEVTERARARGLLEILTASGILDREPAELRRLRDRINALEWERLSLGEDPRRERIGRELDALLLDLADREARHREYATAFLSEEAVRLPEIRRDLLDEETLLLAYSLGEERSFLWAVSPSSFAAYELPPRKEVEKLAELAYGLLSESDRIELEQQSLEAAGDLARVILGPAVGRLDAHPRLVVISDGILHYVPFMALPHPRDGRLLLHHHEIVRLPSASVLAALRRRAAARPTASGTLAVVADPVFDAGDERIRPARSGRIEPASPAPSESLTALKRSARDLGLDGFSRLPAAHREAEAILRLVPEQERLAAVGLAASRELVTTGGLRGYRILHFATHGVLHPRHFELSGLVLSLVGEDGGARDGFLRAHEIAALELPAELVVLSACRTALGERIRAEGLVGLTRSFLNAGASRVVVSLWKVDDEATAELMTRFYRGMLEQGLRPAAALRAAQRAMLRDERFRAPAYWAGFELQGEWR